MRRLRGTMQLPNLDPLGDQARLAIARYRAGAGSRIDIYLDDRQLAALDRMRERIAREKCPPVKGLLPPHVSRTAALRAIFDHYVKITGLDRPELLELYHNDIGPESHVEPTQTEARGSSQEG